MEPHRGHSTNLVGVPTGLICSTAFNAFPVPLHIASVRDSNRSLFKMLAEADDPLTAAGMFEAYMATMFDLDDQDRDGRGPARFRASSYLRLLRGWGYEANSPEGAVLKGWVESRFGLFPTYHKDAITRFSGPAWITYVEEKMSSRFHSNAIQSQLDLLYEFCQWALGRFHSVGQKHITLFRGTNRFEEQYVLSRPDKRHVVVRLNSLLSFTSEREMAESFGDIILEVAVPTVKILFFNELLPKHALKGEGEYVVIGGDYEAKALYY
ncbi:MAG: NAD(+)--dinitrogen-reductase ADP-D-ribosyltransferase [Rhizomicrobium sp.]|nr:NAD(+)--dinitrogen-reductase ADP-D-ribosyltransferase [Rhizomicrobium sp.]